MKLPKVYVVVAVLTVRGGDPLCVYRIAQDAAHLCRWGRPCVVKCALLHTNS